MEIMLSHLGIGMAYDALDGLNIHAQRLSRLFSLYQSIIALLKIFIPISVVRLTFILQILSKSSTKVTLLTLRKLNASIFLEKCAEYIFLADQKAIYLQSKKLAKT